MNAGLGFLDGTGRSVDGTEAIIPIFIKDSADRIIFIGTGFFISNHGIFATARHVLLDNYNKKYNPIYVIHFLSTDRYLFRRVLHITTHKVGDVAIGALAPMKNEATEQLLLNKILTLTRRMPEVGETAITFAYPKSLIDHDAITKVFCNTSWHSGEILEHHPKGRDRHMLPGDCYRTNIEILGGASGGPVADKEGNVFGINSTGFEGTNDSYVSSIRDTFDLSIPESVTADGTKCPTITQLAERNYAKIM